MNEVPLNPHQHVNPYIAGSPVTGTEMFYGREDVFSFIRRNLIGRHRDTPVVLYGQRRTGKTSVLYQLHRHLDPSYRCVFIDLHGLNLHGMGNLMLGIANSIRRGLQRDHELAVEAPDRAVFLADPRSAFEAFLDRVWTVLETGHLVLMLDEVIRLDEEVRAARLERDIFDYLRHLMQHQPRLNFIFSLGSGLEEMAKDYAFLFSVSLYHRISFLEPEAASKLITQPVRDHYRVAPQAVTKILQITSGHPYYTQLVCHCIFDLWSRSPKPMMSVADVDAVMAEAIELGSANLTYVWEDSSPGEQALMAGMAAVMRGGADPVNVDQVRDAWRKVTVSLPEHEVAQALRSLTSRDVVAGRQTYAFTVDLQRMWLEKHRRLDWVKDQLAESVQQWNRSAAPLPADTISLHAGGPGASSASGVPHDGEGRVLAGTRPRITRRRRYLAITAAVMAVLAGYLATARAAHVFPFPNNSPFLRIQLLPNYSPAQNNPAAQNSMQGLVQLLLGPHEHECHPMPPPHLWNMPGLVQELHCTDPGLKGGNVYAYQLNSAINYRTAWQNFNKWWKFLPGNAGKTCPPKHAAFGTSSFSNSALPPSAYPVVECGPLALRPNNTAPAYAWTFPTNNAFVIAEGASGSSFSALVSWLTESPTAEPTRSTTATTPPVPAAPSDLTVSAVDPNAIGLNWRINSGDQTGFEISNGSTSIDVGADSDSYTWGDLSSGTYMCFKILAYNSAGDSPWDPSIPPYYVCTTTPGSSSSPSQSPSISPPPAPSDLTVYAVDPNAIGLNWKVNSSDQTGFEISNGVTSIYVGALSDSYTWGGLSPGTYMCFKILAYNSAGDSAWYPSVSPYYVCTTTPTS